MSGFPKGMILGTMGLNTHSAAQTNTLPEDKEQVNAKDVDGRTPLHWAASSGSLDTTRNLLNKKADVNMPDIHGWTPLHIAVSAGHFNVVSELIGEGADVTRENDKGITPLHYAASKSHIDIGRLLISRGADINAMDKAKQLPLHRAATTGSVGFIDLLLQPPTPSGGKKARLNVADRIGNTPLHLAMESAHAEAAVRLIMAGADRTRQNLDGETPENVAGVGDQEQKNAKKYVIDLCGDSS